MPRRSATEHPRRSATEHLRRTERSGDRGTAMLLYPAGVMVLLVLAAITVDLTLVRSARQELHSVLQVAADDAAGAADPDRLRAGDHLTVDLARARRIVAADLERTDLPGDLTGPVQVTAGDDLGEVRVEASMEVPSVFIGALPGVADRTVVTATATGRRIPL